jgi:hypothetical protein
MMLYWYTGVMMLRVDEGMNNQVRYGDEIGRVKKTMVG